MLFEYFALLLIIIIVLSAVSNKDRGSRWGDRREGLGRVSQEEQLSRTRPLLRPAQVHGHLQLLPQAVHLVWAFLELICAATAGHGSWPLHNWGLSSRFTYETNSSIKATLTAAALLDWSSFSSI